MPTGAGRAGSTNAAAVAGVTVLDAVCVLFFSASGQLDLYIQTMARAGIRLVIPEEVLREVRNRASRNGWDISRLDLILTPDPFVTSGSPPLRVIPEITAAQAPALELLDQVCRRHPAVRDRIVSAGKGEPTDAAGAHQAARGAHASETGSPMPGGEHFGECVVVTHGVLAHRAGVPVRVAIDDLDGQELAQLHCLDVFTVEDALALAVEHDVIDLIGARKAYLKMMDYGDSLPSWEASGLAKRIKAEARARKRAASG